MKNALIMKTVAELFFKMIEKSGHLLKVNLLDFFMQNASDAYRCVLIVYFNFFVIIGPRTK